VTLKTGLMAENILNFKNSIFYITVFYCIFDEMNDNLGQRDF